MLLTADAVEEMHALKYLQLRTLHQQNTICKEFDNVRLASGVVIFLGFKHLVLVCNVMPVELILWLTFNYNHHHNQVKTEEFATNQGRSLAKQNYKNWYVEMPLWTQTYNVCMHYTLLQFVIACFRCFGKLRDRD